MYNEFYGLSEKPFELTLDPRFLFLTPSHRETIASMIEGIRNRRGFISVTGEVGTGKTTLIRFLMSKLEAEERVKIAFIFHPTITFKELLRNILLGLGLEITNGAKGALLRQLNEYLVQMANRDETFVVIIDEAQDLPLEVMGELGMLPKLERLQVVFVGQPELEDKLHSQGLRQLERRIGIKCQIKPFVEKESADYIDHRLRLAGSSSSQVFTPKAISMICSYAQGISRVTNILCDNAFLLGYSLSRKKIDVDIIHKVIKSMECPPPHKTLFSKIVTAANEFRTSPLKLNVHLSKTSLIVLSIFCIGGFVLLIHRYFQPPAQVWNIKSLRNPYDDTKPSSTPLSPHKMMKEISKSDTHQQPGDLKPISPELPKLISPGTTPLTSISKGDKLGEMAAIKKGQTISSLAQKYYRMVNKTLMDLILVSNPGITDVHLILVDQKIKIPKITEELLIIKSPENTYKINAGTFQTPIFARLYRDEQALKGRKIEILPRRVSPQETWYRVVIGEFDSEDEVLEMIDLLKGKDLLPAFGGLPKIE
jgi:type II secretory pathway predicted ATPase ExeA/phage tail protein X